ncbi:ribosome maturation factor RimM [Kushneria phosphatilytica]|uniref:Ribosome maturation factor RimM n=1 Tax=Kushneria phosphatilytica TaxID=657387 RepID=A0A1S1NXF1_9GAMM|nr:ribosome maturation factor RimM [Kushneria phosphatilytica]OHV10878.1 ribosome maturation factor RimM [Kushneria phosphatilytica]QEL12040.1 ribosome maturation factor RimM [Kushneria phosphatilytica]
MQTVVANGNDEFVVLGKLNSPHGVRGWIRVYSWTTPIDGIFDYPRWTVEVGDSRRCLNVVEGQRHGKGLIARLEGVDSRSDAEELTNARILLPTEALPTLESGEYYWYQLEGLTVSTIDGQSLGTVAWLFETGANDVLVIKGDRERLIPFLPDEVIQDIDLDAGTMTVNWDPDF